MDQAPLRSLRYVIVVVGAIAMTAPLAGCTSGQAATSKADTRHGTTTTTRPSANGNTTTTSTTAVGQDPTTTTTTQPVATTSTTNGSPSTTTSSSPSSTTTTTVTKAVTPALVPLSNETALYEPAQFRYTQDGSGYVDGLTWSSWNTRGASATGTLHVNNCSPNCASGSYGSYAAAVTLSDPQQTAQGYVFTQMAISAPGSPDPSQSFAIPR